MVIDAPNPFHLTARDVRDILEQAMAATVNEQTRRPAGERLYVLYDRERLAEVPGVAGDRTVVMGQRHNVVALYDYRHAAWITRDTLWESGPGVPSSRQWHRADPPGRRVCGFVPECDELEFVDADC